MRQLILMEILKMQLNIENDNNSNNNNNNNNNHGNNIVFTIKDTKLYVSVVTYQQQTIKIYQNFLEKRFQRPVYWNEQNKKWK